MPDPNADLIGFQYTVSEGTPAEETVTVVGTPEYAVGGEHHWMTNYVKIRYGIAGHESLRPVVAVRARKQIDGG